MRPSQGGARLCQSSYECSYFVLRRVRTCYKSKLDAAPDFNKALPDYYFRNKEELHRFVLETMIAQVRVAMESPEVLTMQPTERVCALVNTTFDFVMRNPDYPRLIQREMMSDRRRLHWMVVYYLPPPIAPTSCSDDPGRNCAQSISLDPDQTVFTIFGMIQHYFATGPLASQIWKRNIWLPKNVAERRQAVLDFIEHGLFLANSNSQ